MSSQQTTNQQIRSNDFEPTVDPRPVESCIERRLQELKGILLNQANYIANLEYDLKKAKAWQEVLKQEQAGLNQYLHPAG